MHNTPKQLELFEGLSKTRHNVDIENESARELFESIDHHPDLRQVSLMTSDGIHIFGFKKKDSSSDDLTMMGLPGFLQSGIHMLPLMKAVCSKDSDNPNKPAIPFLAVSPPSSGQSILFNKPMAEVVEEDYLCEYRGVIRELDLPTVLFGYSIGGLDAQILTSENSSQVFGLIMAASVKNRDICRRKHSVVKTRKKIEEVLAKKEGRKPTDVRIYIPERDMQGEQIDLFNDNDDIPEFTLWYDELRNATGSYARWDSYKRERYGIDTERIKMPILVFTAREDNGRTTSEYYPVDPEEIWEIESEVENRRISLADVLKNPIDDPPITEISPYDKRVVIEGATHGSLLLSEEHVKIVGDTIVKNWQKFELYKNSKH